MEAQRSPWTPDLNGRVFGSLEVIKFLGARAGTTGHAYWRCRCSCGALRDVRGTKLATGRTTACSACARTAGAEAARPKRRSRAANGAFNRLARSYRANAAKRRIAFSLTDEDLRELFAGACRYCGCAPSQEARGPSSFCPVLTYNGIDRVQNDVGYVRGNVVSCCRTCNFAKGALTQPEFLSWARRVASHNPQS